METGPVAPMMEPRPMRGRVVDDERNTLRMCLEELGYEVREVATPDAALAQSPANFAFADPCLGTTSGLDLLPARRRGVPPPVLHQPISQALVYWHGDRASLGVAFGTNIRR